MGPVPVSSLIPSRELDLTLRLAAGRLDAASRRLWYNPRLKSVFPEYLVRLYHVGRATLALMAIARERARMLAPECPVAARLEPFLARHLVEERHHDEWLLQDLEVLGVPRSAVITRIPPPEIAALIGSLHYWVLHHHPVALVAYLFVAEGHPFEREFLDEVVARTGLPAPALSWFYKHAVLDIRHGADIREFLDTLPLTEDHRTLLRTTVIGLAENMAVFMERVMGTADRLPENTLA